MPRQESNLEIAQRLADTVREDISEIPLTDVQRAQILALLAGAYATIAVAKGERE